MMVISAQFQFKSTPINVLQVLPECEAMTETPSNGEWRRSAVADVV
jgi:hypothetical protein